MAARAEVDGIHVRFQFISASTAFCISRGLGRAIAPVRSFESHAACRPCVSTLLNVETSEPRKAMPGTLIGSTER